VARVEQRISEAQKMGYDEIVISSHSKLGKEKFAIKLISCGKVEEVFQHLFG